MGFYIFFWVCFILCILCVVRAQAQKNKGAHGLAYWAGGSQTFPSLFPQQPNQVKLQILSWAKASSPFLGHHHGPCCVCICVSLWPSANLWIWPEQSYRILAQIGVKAVLHKIAKPKNRTRMTAPLWPQGGTEKVPFHAGGEGPMQCLVLLHRARGRQRTRLPKQSNLMSWYMLMCRFLGQHRLQESKQLH